MQRCGMWVIVGDRKIDQSDQTNPRFVHPTRRARRRNGIAAPGQVAAGEGGDLGGGSWQQLSLRRRHSCHGRHPEPKAVDNNNEGWELVSPTLIPPAKRCSLDAEEVGDTIKQSLDRTMKHVAGLDLTR